LSWQPRRLALRICNKGTPRAEAGIEDEQGMGQWGNTMPDQGEEVSTRDNTGQAERERERGRGRKAIVHQRDACILSWLRMNSIA
jgi:hypothetical protein